MKRDIKFRAWNGDRIISWDEMIDDYLAINNLSSYSTMQYTGLKDKNGREIYEGDIVQFTIEHEEEIDDVTYREAVHFSEGCFNVDGEVPLNAFSDECEVIGNIYENPELLNNP